MPAKRTSRAFWRCSFVSHNRTRVFIFINHVDVHIKLRVRSVVLFFNSLRAFVCVPHFTFFGASVLSETKARVVLPKPSIDWNLSAYVRVTVLHGESLNLQNCLIGANVLAG